MQDSFRPLTKAEVRLLKGKISSQGRRRSRYRARIARVSVGLWIAGSVLTLVANQARSERVVVLIAWAAIASLIAVWLLLEDKSGRAFRVGAFEDALRRNEAHVIRIQSDQMVALDEQEDEGACFAFQVADRIVFVSGQEFYPSASFPNSDFALVEISDSRGRIVEMAIETAGKKLQPIRTIAAESKSRLQIPDHLHIILGRLDDIERLLAG